MVKCKLIWMILDIDLMIEMRSLTNILMNDVPLGADLISLLLRLIIDKYGEEIGNICSFLFDLDTSNIRSEQLYFFVSYAVDTLYIRTLAQCNHWRL